MKNLKFIFIFILSICGVSSINAETIVVSSVQELREAVKLADPGDTIFVRGGRYAFTEELEIERSGKPFERIYLFSFPEDEERPLFDFSAMEEDSSNKGITLEASYWHIKGLDIVEAGDNGMQIKRGHHNIVEHCTFSGCSDTGLQIDTGSSYNTILNCDSFFNADSKLENADGFAVKMDTGTGNKFIGCRAWNNLDDGWDGYLRETDSVTTIYENCWAFRNGYLEDGTEGEGDGNGFKTGGSDSKLLQHNAIYKNCIASGNAEEGFDHNSNRGKVVLFNCIAHDNGTNLGFGKENPLAKLIIKNSAVLGEPGKVFAVLMDISDNSWQLNEVAADASDFVSLDMELLAQPRNPDGSLPEIPYLHLAEGSDLINEGVPVGIPFSGPAPDIGVFEYGDCPMK